MRSRTGRRSDATSFVAAKRSFAYLVSYITIDQERCKGCELCITVCPKKLIKIDKQLNSSGTYPAIFTSKDNCTGCKVCAEMCPDICIEVFK